MTTSGTSAFVVTARDFVRQALIETRIIASGREPRAAELDDCLFRLNMMLKTWQTQGAGLWRNDSATVTVLAGQSSVVLPAGAREVTDARVVVNASYERPMAKWERAEFQVIPNKAAIGSPSVFYVDRQRDTATLNVWPVPTTDTQIKIEFDRALETVEDPAETLDVPEEYAETVMLNLAVRCAPIFGAELTQMQVARAQYLEQQMIDDSRASSIYMGAWGA